MRVNVWSEEENEKRYPNFEEVNHPKKRETLKLEMINQTLKICFSFFSMFKKETEKREKKFTFGYRVKRSLIILNDFSYSNYSLD